MTWPFNDSEAGDDPAFLSSECSQWGLYQNKVTSSFAPFKGQVTEQTTVEWFIEGQRSIHVPGLSPPQFRNVSYEKPLCELSTGAKSNVILCPHSYYIPKTWLNKNYPPTNSPLKQIKVPPLSDLPSEMFSLLSSFFSGQRTDCELGKGSIDHVQESAESQSNVRRELPCNS